MIERLKRLAASFDEQFEAMPSRQRALLVGLATGIFVVICAGSTYALFNNQSARESQVRAAKQNLRDVQELATEYAVLRARIDAAEARMGEFKANQINTYISQWASKAGLAANLQGIKEGKERSVGGFREQAYVVEINDGSLEGVVRLLYSIETSPYPLKIGNAEFKVQERRDERFLDVDLVVLAYTKV